MALVLVTLAAGAVAVLARSNPARSHPTLDPWAAWLIRGRRARI